MKTYRTIALFQDDQAKRTKKEEREKEKKNWATSRSFLIIIYSCL